jgi:hypothetical protein
MFPGTRESRYGHAIDIIFAGLWLTATALLIRPGAIRRVRPGQPRPAAGAGTSAPSARPISGEPADDDGSNGRGLAATVRDALRDG